MHLITRYGGTCPKHSNKVRGRAARGGHLRGKKNGSIDRCLADAGIPLVLYVGVLTGSS